MSAPVSRLRLLIDRWPNARWRTVIGGRKWVLVLFTQGSAAPAVPTEPGGEAP